MLSRDDIKNAIAEGHLKIYPFNEKNLTGIGYNLSTTNFAFSTNQGVLLTINEETRSNGAIHYVIIPPNDTIFFFSKEYIEVDKSLAGIFLTKVSRACQGLGNISTTLDPTWKGQLIIAINNPTSREIRFDLDEKSGNIMTLLLYKLDTPVTGGEVHDNNEGRCDLLLKYFEDIKYLKISKENKEKHLQIRNFIVNQFTISLNGKDDFIGNFDNCPLDAETKKVKKLCATLGKLEKDRKDFIENTYELGQYGYYVALQDDESANLLKNCILYNMKREVRIRNFEENSKNEVALREYITMDRLIEHNIFKEEGSRKENKEIRILLENVSGDIEIRRLILQIISDYIEIINYELETIGHTRRIEWQNKEIYKYAGAGSEYDLMLKEEKRKKNRKGNNRFLVSCIISAIAFGFLILLICFGVIDTQKWIAIGTIAGVAISIYSFSYANYKKDGVK